MSLAEDAMTQPDHPAKPAPPDNSSGLDQADRRVSYRVHIPVSLSRPSIYLRNGDDTVKARLLDISRNGAAALLQGSFDAMVGSYVPCQIGLPDSSFSATAQVRSSKTQRNHMRLGLLFTDLSINEHYQIDASIASLERSLRRQYSYLMK